MPVAGPFHPPYYLKNPYIQTILASIKVRAWGKNPMVDAEQEMILEAGNGIRLQGYLSPQQGPPAKGVVILLSGWEGSAESTYILSTGRTLYEQGYDIFRLNFRDHGSSHHLNEGLFYVTLIDEVFESVRQVAALNSDTPCFLVGFSLGGNFSLRIARKCTEKNIENLAHIVAISPLLDPETSTDAIDKDWLLKRYFLKKWKRSLVKKEHLFPHLYHFSDLVTLNSCREMTDILLDRYSDYSDTLDYFKAYTLTRKALKKIPVPTTLIISEDDPVIPTGDFHALELNEKINLIVQQFGGHNGFIDSFPSGCWYERKLLEIFDPLATAHKKGC